MNYKQIISGIIASSFILISAYAVVATPNSNVDIFSPSNNVIQLDVATTL